MGPQSADDLTSVHEALVDLLEEMPAARLLRLLCPLVGLEPREVVGVLRASSVESLLAQLESHELE